MTKNTNSKNKKIGIFGGSFDPLHNGHLIIASYAIEHFSLDTLFIVPAYIPPHKKGTFAPFSKRFNWLKKVFFNSTKIKVSDYEGNNKDISYTIKTVRHFNEKSDSKPFLIIGEDSYRDIKNWHKYRDILEESVVCVYPRNIHKDDDVIIDKESPLFFDAPLIDISSSLIRERISNKKSVFGMLPCLISKEVVEFYEKVL